LNGLSILNVELPLGVGRERSFGSLSSFKAKNESVNIKMETLANCSTFSGYSNGIYVIRLTA
jgi:hypothetical protein